jgi:hypothetical protein
MGSLSTRRSASSWHSKLLSSIIRCLPKASDPYPELPHSKDRQSAPSISGHAELLQAIYAPRCDHPSITAKRSLRPQSQGLPPHNLDTGTPQRFRKLQSEFVTRHYTGAPRSNRATCIRHRCLHVRHGCRATAARREPLAATRPFL